MIADRAAGALLTAQVRVDEAMLKKHRSDFTDKLMEKLAQLDAEDAKTIDQAAI